MTNGKTSCSPKAANIFFAGEINAFFRCGFSLSVLRAADTACLFLPPLLLLLLLYSPVTGCWCFPRALLSLIIVAFTSSSSNPSTLAFPSSFYPDLARQGAKKSLPLLCVSQKFCLLQIPLLLQEQILQSDSVLDEKNEEGSQGQKQSLRGENPFPVPKKGFSL